MTRVLHRLFSAATVVSATAVLATALDAGEGALERGFGTQLDLDVVEIEVVVVDGEGRPVPGLDAGDFELWVDEEPTAISQFYAASGAVASGPPAEGEQPRGDGTSGPAGAPAPWTVAVLIDEVTSQPSLRKGALASLGAFVSGLPPGSRVSVARSDGEVEVVLPLTSDLTAARAAVDALALRPSQGGRGRLEEQRAIEDLVGIHEMFHGKCDQNEIEDLYRSAAIYSRQRRIAAEASLRAPTVVARALAPLEGRRLLVYLSGGVETEPGRPVFDAVQRLCPSAATFPRAAWQPERSLLPAVERATLAIVGSGVTLYGFDLAGREVDGSVGGNLPFMPPPPIGAEMEDRHARQQVLFAAATDSGGRAFLDLARAQPALEAMEREVETAYSLGFVPNHAAEGGQHRLRVEARRAGFEVRHRRTFRHATADEQARGEALAALSGESRLSVLGASAQIGRIAPRRGEKRRFDVSLWLRVPLRELALAPGDDGVLSGNLHLYLTARDEHDRESPIQAVDVPLTVPPSRVASGDLLYEIKAVMRPGHHRLALRVEDLRTGAADVLDLDVEVLPPS